MSETTPQKIVAGMLAIRFGPKLFDEKALMADVEKYFSNEAGAVINALKFNGFNIAAMEGEIIRLRVQEETLRQQRDALAEAATKFLESIEWDEDGATFHPDPGCIKCTEGVTPNHLKTGLCGYHALKSALNSMEADNEV